MATTKTRIHGKGDYRVEEYVAGGAGIYPGMLVMINSSGQVVVHNNEGGRAEKLIAQEDVLQGRTKDTVYASGDIVSCLLPVQGAELNVMIEDGQNIAIGDELISSGNGKFIKASAIGSGDTVDEVLFVAVEVCDTTVSGVADTLCAARAK